MIRAFGGEVSWDETIAPGSTFKEDAENVTHHICDRPRESVNMKFVGARYYIQPQWVFDSINRRQTLPEQEYFVGEMLPPHLSPFVGADRRVGDYMPPEEKRMLGLEEKKKEEEEEEESEEEGGAEDEESSEEEEEDEEEEEGSDESEDGEKGDEKEKKKRLAKMSVAVGKPATGVKPDPKAIEEEEFKLRKMMIKKKHKGLYNSMMKSRKRRVHESRQLEWKRKEHDNKAKEERKEKKRQAKKTVEAK